MTTQQIKNVLAGRWPASDLMNLVLHGELSTERASWWWKHHYGSDASLQKAAEQEEDERYSGDYRLTEEFMVRSMPR